MARNTLKRVLCSYVLIDHETDCIFVDYSNTGKKWQMITAKHMRHICLHGGAVIGHNVAFK